MSDDEPRRFLTSQDVADLFEVDAKTIHNWVARGQLSALKMPGGHLRFDVLTLEKEASALGWPLPEWLRDRVRALGAA